ncbi:hypothetical protein MASR2M29_16750 [Spirochaetota bacterium]
MNQDQLKELLLGLEQTQSDFSVILSGKKSSVVNGLYKPLSREIIIHNKNFETEGQLLYTAIHEFAHHLHCERRAFVPGARSHTNEFWSIFHELLDKAEKLGIYRNCFDKDPEFVVLSGKIRELMPENGKLMLELGKLIAQARELCKKNFVRFEDYLDRILAIPRNSAASAIKAFELELPAELGWDGMKLVSGIKNPDTRNYAIEAFKAGKSQESVKAMIRPQQPENDPKARLDKEKSRIERSIENLKKRLEFIEEELGKYTG